MFETISKTERSMVNKILNLIRQTLAPICTMIANGRVNLSNLHLPSFNLSFKQRKSKSPNSQIALKTVDQSSSRVNQNPLVISRPGQVATELIDTVQVKSDLPAIENLQQFNQNLPDYQNLDWTTWQNEMKKLKVINLEQNLLFNVPKELHNFKKKCFMLALKFQSILHNFVELTNNEYYLWAESDQDLKNKLEELTDLYYQTVQTKQDLIPKINLELANIIRILLEFLISKVRILVNYWQNSKEAVLNQSINFSNGFLYPLPFQVGQAYLRSLDTKLNN